MFNPVSTYRIQFHKDFTFKHFKQIIPYLQELGIKTLYASPIFKSTPGSTHGYDGTNPLQINPEIGTIEELRSISQKLKSIGISWLQDIVPNHMAFHPDNAWLMDVLEKGERSLFKDYFDTALSDRFYQGKIMVPFLGDDLEKIISDGQLKIAYNGQRLQFQYAEQSYPLQLTSYHTVLGSLQVPNQAVTGVLDQVNQVNSIDDLAQFSPEMDELLKQLTGLTADAGVSKWLNECLDKVNEGKALLLQIANQQHYRLCNWQETDSHITYRRFFTVNGLICLNIQKPEVFDHFHQFIKSLVKEGVFQGLRIDHIDGLYNPAQYLQDLRELVGPDVYIVVEKILEQGEELADRWPIQGNTGYDFLATVNNLFTNVSSKNSLTDYYNQLTGNFASVQQQTEEKKRHILTRHMAGELDNLLALFLSTGVAARQKVKDDVLKEAIAQLLIKCPVYRYYGDTLPLKSTDKLAFKNIFEEIRQENPDLTAGVNLLADAFFKKSDKPAQMLDFYHRCMQFTGPLMAKGVEDTLMYTDNFFIAHNEVGDNPDSFGLSVDGFHHQMLSRQHNWPLGINGTSTHDTKRGEDVRARLNVLSDLSDEWLQLCDTWKRQNSKLKQKAGPDGNDEYFIYQTLLGAYPMPGQPDDNFAERLGQYLEKTLREGKQHSDWANPDTPYEGATQQFATAILDTAKPFWKTFKTFHRKAADYGVVNSLAQVLLKFTAPGVPDVYQGCEHWDFSLVDPDNRRPVDYKLRTEILRTQKDLTTLWQNRFDGGIKVWLVKQLAEMRNGAQLLFSNGKYIPLNVEGTYAANILAFARQYKREWYITVVPLNLAALCEAAGRSIDQFDWKDTTIVTPEGAPADYENLLDGSRGKNLSVKALFKQLPVALIKLSYPSNGRGSGLLMHITSLPTNFGVGDLGPSARNFVDLLQRTYQTYWQLLPLTPIESQDGYSPYSSYSSMAGNTLLISPELLLADDLLTEDDLLRHQLPAGNSVDYLSATRVKDELFQAAWLRFKEGSAEFLQDAFEQFKVAEDSWLDDFAIYLELKRHHGGQPWYKWPDKYRLRDKKLLNAFKKENTEALEQAKWLQFIFIRQWHQLKNYCHDACIKLFGDLPFYVSYDSVDVWANQELFSIDKAGNLQFVAGVPPDYFNANGQLWGMPVFKWDVLKQTGYGWWLKRVRKNLELFDVLRLDHFRAFADYWAVPAGEETAINGTWELGPGSDFFNVLKAEFPEMPFIAEDLGDVDDSVYQLRDEFELPGMKVMQFAFGGDMPHSPNLPHNHKPNFVAYTGTHDNNTTKGWYRKDAGKSERKNLQMYTGIKVDQKNVSSVLIKAAMNTVSKLCITPVQDLLNLDERSRMNMPSSTGNNWLWRMDNNMLANFPEKKLRRLTITSGRY